MESAAGDKEEGVVGESEGERRRGGEEAGWRGGLQGRAWGGAGVGRMKRWGSRAGRMEKRGMEDGEERRGLGTLGASAVGEAVAVRLATAPTTVLVRWRAARARPPSRGAPPATCQHLPGQTSLTHVLASSPWHFSAFPASVPFVFHARFSPFV